MYVVQNLIDLTASTAESDVFNGKIHKKYHPLIALGAEQFAFIRRQLRTMPKKQKQGLMGSSLVSM
jgi:hypothetical protein